MFTDKFIAESVLPEIKSTGGATVLVSPYGMPPAILRMDQYQPKTWVVALGACPVDVPLDGLEANELTILANLVLDSFHRNAWSAVGFWAFEGRLYVEPVETFTSHEMAVQAAKDCDQIAIYAMHTGETEFLVPEHNYVVGADS